MSEVLPPEALKVLPPPDLGKLTARTMEGRLECRRIVEHALKMGWLVPGSWQGSTRAPDGKGRWHWSAS